MIKKICFLTNCDDEIFTLPLLIYLNKNLSDKSIKIVFLKGLNTKERIIKTILSIKIIEILKILILKIFFIFNKNNILKKINNYLYIDNINSKKGLDFLLKNNFDLIVSINCPQIISKKILNTIPSEFVNFHPGKLTEYRGIFIPFHCIYNKEDKIYLSFHKIDEGIDSGILINQVSHSIEKKDGIFSLYKKIFLSKKSKNFILNNIVKYDKLKNNSIDTSRLKNTYYKFPSIFKIIKFKLGLLD